MIYLNNIYRAFRFSFEKNLWENLVKLTGLSLSLIERSNKFCINMITSPNPNSTAEKIRRKKVKERIERLSVEYATKRDITYRLIHKNSAVNNKCRAVETLMTSVESTKTKVIMKRLSSLINIVYEKNGSVFMCSWFLKIKENRNWLTATVSSWSCREYCKVKVHKIKRTTVNNIVG